ncbi:MAG: glycosyltransferase [bacterium]
MRVLLMVPELNVGGVETHVSALAEGMRRLGNEVLVISNGGALVPELERHGVEHAAYPVHRKSPLTIREMSGEVRRLAEERGIDVVHAHSRVPAWIGHFATRGAGASFVLTAHAQYAPHVGSRVMAWGDRIICVSNVIREHIVSRLGAAPLKIRVVYNGVDINEVREALGRARAREAIKEELGHPPGAPLVGVISRLTATKGLRYFIEAFRLLRARNPEVRGVIVGDGPLRRELGEAAQGAGLGKVLTFTGVRMDIYNVLSALDVYVVSSVSEGFPMGCLEALSCRVPIVATRVGGIPEMLEDGGTALLVEPRDPEGLARRVEELLKDGALRERLSGEGYRTVLERFSKEKMLESIREVYAEAVEEKRAGGRKYYIRSRAARPRILLTLPELNVGGVETHVLDLAGGLRSGGFQPLVVSFGGQLVEKLEMSRVDHIKLPVHSKSPATIFRMAAKMRKVIRENRVDMVHAHSRVPAWICYLATRGTSLPFLTTAHSTYSVHLGSRVMVWSDYTLAVSGYVRDHMIRNFGADPERIRVVHNGVSACGDDDTLRRTRAEYRGEWGIDEGSPVVGMVASLTPRKGYGYFLQAAGRIAEEFSGVVFLAIGGGVQMDELKAMRSQIGIPEERFRFLGVRGDVRNLLAAMDIFVLSSTSEGLPYVILEAMAMGKPVVSSGVGGIPEAVTSGREGVLVAPGDVDELTRALAWLLSEPRRRVEMGEAARKRVRETFTVERMVGETEEVYRLMLS